MNKSSENMEFEKAAILRDQINTIEVTLEKQNIQLTEDVNHDIIAIANNDKQASVVILSVRSGKTTRKDDLILKQIDGMNDRQILTEFIKQYYSTAPIADEIIVEYPIEDKGLITQWLE